MSRCRAGLLLLAILSAVSLGAAASGPSSNEQSPNEQLPAGPMQDKAALGCATCHEARIIVQQRLSKAAWTKEVDKMIKWGALVDSQDKDALIEYLSTSFSTDKPEYIADRSRAGPAAKKK